MNFLEDDDVTYFSNSFLTHLAGKSKTWLFPRELLVLVVGIGVEKLSTGIVIHITRPSVKNSQNNFHFEA